MKAAIVALLVATTAHGVATAAEQALPEGDPRPDAVLRDPDFGVESTRFGLERRVEMYQWRRDGRGYSNLWNAAAIDSGSFDRGHRNPPRLPVRNRQWWVQSVTLDGRALAMESVRVLGQWQAMHPSFSRLPANYAAQFQPEGEGLASSFNPLDPQVGDVRITWYEYVLPPLAGKVQMLGGQWELSPNAARASAATPTAAVDIAAATVEPARKLSPWLVLVAAAVLAGLWFLIRAITGGKP